MLRFNKPSDIFFALTVIIIFRKIILAVNISNVNDTIVSNMKAYVITTKLKLSPGMINSCKHIGFTPVLVSAVQPYGDLYNFHKMSFLRSVFPKVDNRKNNGMQLSLTEIALIASHRKALKTAANDPDISEHNWVLILEDDARLVPWVYGNASSMICEATKYILSIKRLNAILYLGLCGGKCSNKTIMLPSRGNLSTDCIGACSHAYMVTKSRAKSLFKNLYATGNNVHIDSQAIKYFSRTHNAFGLGMEFSYGNFHTGIMYQCCRKYSNMGTKLNSKYEINNIFKRITCHRMNHSDSMENVMFEFATLVGVCVSKLIHPDYCASFYSTKDKNKIEPTIQTFYNTFRIPETSCPISNSITYKENSQSENTITYDDEVMKQKNGATLVGHFQSYKYFHPFAKSIVIDEFTFPRTTLKASIDYFKHFHQDSSDNVVCAHIANRDIVTEKKGRLYNKWAMSDDYYSKAINIMVQKLGKIKLIIFIGGYLYPTKQDYQWLKINIIDPYSISKNVKLVIGNVTTFDPMMTMQILAICPNLIMSVSTYSWWAAYLGEHMNVIAPETLYDGIGFKPHDYYLPEWTLINEKS